MTTTAVINSDEINSVSFPGSEAGLALVELVGTVEIAGSISALTLRLTAKAETSPAATTSLPTTKLRLRIAAQAGCSATSSASALSRIHLSPIQQSAAAEVSVGVLCRRITSASTQTLASVSAASKVALFRGAATNAVAESFVYSIQETYISVSGAASADAQPAYLLRKKPASAVTAGLVLHGVSPNLTFRPAASALVQVQSVVNELTVSYVSVNEVASAVCASILSLNKRIAIPTAIAANAQASATPKLVSYVSADTSPAASVPPAVFYFKRTASAQTEATIIYAIEASDFTATKPAPDERVMVLPAINRRIEVTE